MWTWGHGVTLNAGKGIHQKVSPLWGRDVHALLHLCSRGHAEVSYPITSHLCLGSLQSTGTRHLEPFLLPGLLSEFSLIISHIKGPGSDNSLGCCCLRYSTGVSGGLVWGGECSHALACEKSEDDHKEPVLFYLYTGLRSNLVPGSYCQGASALTY